LFLVALTLLAWRRLAAIDAVAVPPARELAVLSKVPLFHPLSVAAKEQLASRLSASIVPAGTTIVTEGKPGDDFYIIVEGHADVTRGGQHVRSQGPGDYFGEIALLRDVPRTATVTALDEMELCTIGRDDFLAVVTGHAAVRAAGEAVASERLATASQAEVSAPSAGRSAPT
jgi:CRP-like cAMP-binding protein